jgi:FkbM family methyltransferase
MSCPTIDGSLEKWLCAQVVAQRNLFRNKAVLLDVGAYRGEFARTLLGVPDGPFHRAVLFEPNPQSFTWLQERFAANASVQLENCACDCVAGEQTLFCRGESYTGSLLPYADPAPDPASRQFTVNRILLDEYLATRDFRQNIGLIKIDTQGNDWRVLQGSVATLRANRPWLVVELIYTPLYLGQAKPLELAQWLDGQGYSWAAQFNEFYTQAGWLAWSDACFVPKECFPPSGTAFFPRPSAPAAGQSLPSAAAARKNLWQRWRNRLAS